MKAYVVGDGIILHYQNLWSGVHEDLESAIEGLKAKLKEYENSERQRLIQIINHFNRELEQLPYGVEAVRQEIEALDKKAIHKQLERLRAKEEEWQKRLREVRTYDNGEGF